MVELNHRERTIKVKIVYYGPPVGGKTTNLQVLHQYAQASRRGEMVSINSKQDRTILFDLVPLKAAGFRGFDVRLQLLAVPGQAMYAATRRLVLKGADALVFVANSAADRWDENIQSFREMTQNLLAHQLDPAALPLVLQYNKRDLPQVTPVEMMDRFLNARRVDAHQAVAVRGEGVLETFQAILLRAMQDLATRYRIVEASGVQSLTHWASQAIVSMFGTGSLALEPNPIEPNPIPPPTLPATTAPTQAAPAMPAASTRTGASAAPATPRETKPPERRAVKIQLPEEAVKLAGAGPTARANEYMVETYAQASRDLSDAVTEIKEERDIARQRLEDVQAALASAQEVLSGHPLEPTLRSVLTRMSDAAGSVFGSFLMPEPDRMFRVGARRGLTDEPLLRLPSGARLVSERFLTEVEPRLHQAADSLDLGDALETSNPPLAAVVVVPVRTPLGLQGMALLYYTPDDALPKPDNLAHLAVIARALASSLELARALETVRNAEKSLQLALAGTASVQGLLQIVTFLEELRDRQGAMRRNSKVPTELVDEFTRLAPSLSGALTTARSLLAFSRGEVQKESVPLEDLFALLRTRGTQTYLSPGVGDVRGDPVMLRLALLALVDHAHAVLQVRAVMEGGRIKLSVVEAANAPPRPSGMAPDVNLNLVRRIAELHGGSLLIDNEPGLGPRYTLILTPAG